MTPTKQCDRDGREHTPGPWDYERAVNPNDLQRPWIGRLAENRFSALACGESRAEVEANARLIAAAPDLFAMLELALAVIDRSPGIWLGESKARAILAKARGAS